MLLNIFFIRMFSGLKAVFLSVLLWSILGATVYTLLPSSWEAQGYIRIGRVGGNAIESSATTAVRLGSRGFLKTVLDQLGESNDYDALQKIRGSVQTQLVDDRVLLVKVKASTGNRARTILEALESEISLEHQEAAKDIEDGLRELVSDLEVNRKRLGANCSRGERQKGRVAKCGTGNDPSGFSSKEVELRILLIPPSTEKTAFMQPVYVSDKPVFPNGSMIALISILLGLATAVIYLVRPEGQATAL